MYIGILIFNIAVVRNSSSKSNRDESLNLEILLLCTTQVSTYTILCFRVGQGPATASFMNMVTVAQENNRTKCSAIESGFLFQNDNLLYTFLVRTAHQLV